MQKLANSLILSKKIGFLGAGNLSNAIIHGLQKSAIIPDETIYVSNRNQEKLNKLKDSFSGIHICKSNEELLEKSKIIILGVKPQDLAIALESNRHLISEEHILISLAAGVDIESIYKIIPTTNKIIRWMPNTAMKIQESVIGYCVKDNDETLIQICESILSPLGLAVQVEEGDEMNALMVACASGPAFIYEFMQIWESWLESYGFPQNVCQQLSMQTFLGSVLLAKNNQNLNLSDLQNQITSKKGVTQAGLQHFRSFEFENALMTSFDKAVRRAREIEEDFKKNNKD